MCVCDYSAPGAAAAESRKVGVFFSSFNLNNMVRSAVHLLDELCQGYSSLLSTVDLIG